MGAGYGGFYVDDQRPKEYAHRFAYELLIGPIPEGMEVDHKCKNRRCVRPDPEHVRLTTHAQNCEGRERALGISGARGVYPVHGRDGNLTGRWVAHGPRTKYLGTFDSIKEAAEVALQARLEVFTHSDGR